ncbi:hypothetical protein D9M68_628750 [compost metagenome]
MSMQRNRPISRQAISAASTLGTMPLTISTTIAARLNRAKGAWLAAGATSSTSAGRLSTRKLRPWPCNWRIDFQVPITSRVSPSLSFSSISWVSRASRLRRRPITLRSCWLRKARSARLLPISAESGGRVTSAMPTSWDCSVK